ncbi:MAG: sugar transferase [Lachnospiraceae bacterium]|nr:sugar transferase [Lachnospiraceae bacterium]
MKQEDLHFQTIVLWFLDLIAVTLACILAVRLFHMVPDTKAYAEWERTLVYASCLFYSAAFFWNINTALPSDESMKYGVRNILWKQIFLLISLFFFVLFTGESPKRSLLALFIAAFSFVLILFIRLLYKQIIIRIYRSRGFGTLTVLVTERRHLSASLETFSSIDAFQMHLAGILITDPADTDAEKWKDGIPVPGFKPVPLIQPDDLEDFVRTEPVGYVIFDISRTQMKKMKPEIDLIREDGIGVILRAQQEASDALDTGGRYGKVNRKNFLFLNSLRQRERTQFIKRIIDIVIGLAGSVIAGIVSALIAPFIKFGSKGPLYERVVCIGRDGVHFTRLTFRTDYTGPELKKTLLSKRNSAFGGEEAEDTEPSKTRVGKIIGTLRLTGLPKFFSILKGDMSVVGVNTITEEEYKGREHSYRKCLWCKPGLICPPGSVPVSESPFSDDSSIEPDILYAQNWSLWLDLVTIVDNLRNRYEKSQKRSVE